MADQLTAPYESDGAGAFTPPTATKAGLPSSPTSAQVIAFPQRHPSMLPASPLELRRPSAKHFGGADPEPAKTDIAVLAKLQEIGRPSDSRELCTLLYGTDKIGGTRMAAAVGRLRNHKVAGKKVPLVDDVSGKRRPVRINDAGRGVLALLGLLDGGAA
jgi:hypothetical protein